VSFGMTWWALSDLPHPHTKSRIDWIGVTLLAAALLLLNIGLGAPEADLEGSMAAQSSNWLPWVVGAAAMFVVFLLSQRRIRDPILDLRIFANRNLSAASGINLLVGFCIMVALVSVPIFINVAGGAETIQAALITGYLLCAFTVPMALAAIPGGWLSERLGYRSTVVAGLLIAIAGFWWMSLWRVEMAAQAIAFFDNLRQGPDPSQVRGTGFMVGGLALAGIGLGLTIAPILTAVVNGVGDQERGMASSLVIILRLIGMSISMSSMTAYGLRRTTALSREMITPEDALDLEKTARVALDVVTKIASEIALISLVVAVIAVGVAFLLRRGDELRMEN
jgi:MFS family permease